MNKIKELREKQNMRQIDLAIKLNVSRVAISNWENGVTYPRASLLPKIAAILKCDIDDLLCLSMSKKMT